ncbi:MAG: hypothetical protein EBS42_13260 [Caulobacteraceae bacterium]|nr:hypothetical protein [Caulobacteraceae bacterium]
MNLPYRWIGRPALKMLEVRVPHRLERDEVRRRIDRAIEKAKTEYADKVGEINATWQGEDQVQLGMTVMGMDIDSDVVILVEEIIVKVQVPGMAGLFAGKIRSGIEERLGGLLAVESA